MTPRVIVRVETMIILIVYCKYYSHGMSASQNKYDTVDIVINRYYLDHVFAHDKVLFNGNNHYNDEQIPQPQDYFDVLERGNTRHWIDKFHKRGVDFHVLTLDEQDLYWMKKAVLIGMQTRRPSHIFDDELEQTYLKHKQSMPPGAWFVRTDLVSLKEGVHGIGPYDDFKKVLQSMVTTTPGHMCFNNTSTSCNVYFMRWIDIDPDLEFRVFVYNNNITALSSQHLYSVNETLKQLTDEQIRPIIITILKYFDDVVKSRMEFMGSYTMDLALTRSGEPYFIEPNSFGKYYAAGSALYHWIYDHDTLHETDQIEVRFVNED